MTSIDFNLRACTPLVRLKIRNPQIIAVAGITGSGKTAVTGELAKRLGATVVSWDDYEDISDGPENYVEWYKTSGDVSDWQYPALAETLKTLRSGRALICPATHRRLDPTPTVVFDAPLGRTHTETGQYIDFLVWIDTPPDVALARSILRDYRQKPPAVIDDLFDQLDY